MDTTHVSAAPAQEDAGKIHRADVQMRFADTDALGHVNNGSFVLYAETARLEFLQQLGGAVRTVILAHLSIDFRRQTEYGERITVDTWVDRVGTTSVTLQQKIFANGELAAEVRSVVVCFDYATQRPSPWPAASAVAMRAFTPAASASR